MRVLVALLVMSIALAGCGDKEDKGPGGTPYETPEKEGPYHIITVTSGNAFDPINAKVPSGALVEWRIENNGCILKADDGSFHSSDHAAVSGTAYNNGNIPKGDAWRWEAQDGTFAYGCSGKDIKGTIKVG